MVVTARTFLPCVLTIMANKTNRRELSRFENWRRFFWHTRYFTYIHHQREVLQLGILSSMEGKGLAQSHSFTRKPVAAILLFPLLDAPYAV